MFINKNDKVIRCICAKYFDLKPFLKPLAQQPISIPFHKPKLMKTPPFYMAVPLMRGAFPYRPLWVGPHGQEPT